MIIEREIIERKGKVLKVLTDCPTAEDIAYFQPALNRERIVISKYYDDGEERNPDIPDVLDSIDDELDGLERQLDRFVEAAYAGISSQFSRPS